MKKFFVFIISVFTVLSCSSSEGTVENREIVKTEMVSTHQIISPVLIGKEANSVLRIKVNGEAGAKVSSIDISTEGTSQLTDIEEIQLYYTGNDSAFNVQTPLDRLSKTSSFLHLSADQKLQDGANFFWVSYKINPKADLLNRVDASLDQLKLENGRTLAPANNSLKQSLKLGIALRQRGEDGVHTYRIPGLVTTKEGTLIAAYDIRYENSSDLQGDIDVGINRSTDGGQSWGAMQIIMDMGQWGGRPEAENGIGDPSILVDENTGTIWVAGLWIHGMPGQRAWNASGPGLSPDKTGQFVLVKSEDDGKTWSDPINITKQIKKPEWELLLQGPGRGITTSDGTLVFPAQFKDANGMPYATIVYSKDHGKTWDIGTGAKSNTTEAQVAELSDGSLMLNMRDNRGGARSIYTTDDLGHTWQKHPTSRSALKEPICMASLIQIPDVSTKSAKHSLLFSNPNSTKVRQNMTIKMSTDDGMNWPDEHQILLNEKQGYGYSCMSAVDNNTVGILYEGVGEIYYQKVRLNELTKQQR